MQSLVKRAVSGDKEAFLELIDMYQPSMLRIAHGYFSQEADIADAIQDTILNAYEHISSLKEARYFKTWLIRILINNCSHIYNKNKKYAFDLDAPFTTDSASEIDTPLYRFHELLSYVSDENRLCFQLYYGEELTTREIAAILHMKESTIRSRMHREKNKLKAKLLRDGYAPLQRKENHYDEKKSL